jgi:thiamine biosynthesis protein ThiI
MKFLLRLSPDLTTKADKTRRRFLRILSANMRDAMVSNDIAAHVEPGWVRMMVDAADARAGDVARHVFGVHSMSPVDEIPLETLDALVATAAPHFQPQITGRTFAVRARTGGGAPFRSHDIEVALGAALAPHGKVHLDHPQVTCSVEVRDQRVYLFSGSTPAWRGLPIGSEGRAVALVSGGFDSAVAAWMMLRRGVALDYVFCRLGGPAHQTGTLRVLQVLGTKWSYGDRPRVFVVPFEDVVDRIRERCEPTRWQLVLKRLMYRVAEQIGRETRAQAIVTGESLGQVSSQTLKNLRALDGRLTLPLLRPLVGLDKEEIIARSREIGTHDISATVREYCAIVPDRPATAASQLHVRGDEEQVDFDARAVAEASVMLDLRQIGPRDLSLPDLETETVPAGAIVMDLRSVGAYRIWHWPEALHLHLDGALRILEQLDRGKTYVAYCELGLKSAYLAHRMRERGLTAYNFRGGLRPLVQHAVERGLSPAELVPGDLVP